MSETAELITSEFKALRIRAGLSMDALAQRMGYKRASSIQRYEDPKQYGGGYLKRDLVQKLATALVGKGDPEITAQEVWKLAGPEFSTNRPSLISSYDPDGDENGNGYSREHWAPSFPGALPEIDVKLGAGNGAIGEMINLRIGEETVIGHKVLAEWLMAEAFVKHEAKASPRDTVVMEVIGDSMVPTYQPGDRVMVDMAQTRMLADTVYAISDGTSEPQIKRLQRIPFSDPVRVKIISDNPALETFEVVLDRLTIIGRVCGHIAKR